MTDRLEPCPTPWCEPEHEKYIWQGPDDLFCVICDGCQVEGPSCENEGGAHDAWNTRNTSLAAQDGLVEAGKGLLSALGFAEFDVLDSHNIPFPKPTVEVAAKKLCAALASIEVKS